MSVDDKSTPAPPGEPAGAFDRRSFLQILSVAFGTAALPEMVAGCTDSNETERFEVGDPESLTISRSIKVVRPEDMLVLTIGLVNLRAAGGMVSRLAAGPAFFVVDFPPQCIVEDAAPAPAAGQKVAADFWANAKMGATSRVVFQVPDAFTSAPYTLQSILATCASSSLWLAPPMMGTSATLPQSPPTKSTGAQLIDRQITAALSEDDPAAAARRLAAANEMPTNLAAYAGPATPASLTGTTVTNIEIPYRIQMSPNSLAGFSHATTLVQGASQACEVWHTTLGVRCKVDANGIAIPGTVASATTAGGVDERNAYLRTGRALWTRDFDLGLCGSTTSGTPACAADGANAQPPAVEGSPVWNPSLTPDWRRRIVQLTSFTGANASNAGIAPAKQAIPIQINRLMLSSLGGYFDARGDFDDNVVDRWIHKMAGGREHFVEVVQKGFLMPFGNVATRITITKRNEDPATGPIGTLITFSIIIVDNPVTCYRTSDFVSSGTYGVAAQWPFISVVYKQRRHVIKRNDDPNVWAADLSGAPILAQVVMHDQCGGEICTEVPLFFHALGAGATVAGDMGAAITAYRTALATPVNGTVMSTLPLAGQPSYTNRSFVAPIGGKRIAYAYSKKGDTSFATRDLAFDVQTVGESFAVMPFLTQATVDVESLHQYLKPDPVTNAPAPVQVRYHKNYVAAAGSNTSSPRGNGLDKNNNKSQLLFTLLNPSSVSADFTNRPDGGTGFVAPNMTFNALSRTTGPSYDGTLAPSSSMAPHVMSPMAAPTVPWGGSTGSLPPDTFTDGKFDPAYYLGQGQSALNNLRIFGVFSLTDIIKAVDSAEAAKDLDGLLADATKLAEEAALKYAPKFIAQGLNDIQKVLATIQEVKSQVEFVYTNAKELYTALDSGQVTQILGQASNAALDETQKLIDKGVDEVKTEVGKVITAAQTFYATGMATLGFIENMDVASLTGIPASPPDGSIVQLLQHGKDLEDAIINFANWGYRATMQAKDTAVNAATALSPHVMKANDTSVAEVTNAALKIAQGIQDTFQNKLAQLNDIIDKVGDIATLFKNAEQAIDALKDMTLKIEWQPKIGSFSAFGFTIFRPASQHALTLAMEVRAKSSPGKDAGVDLSCRLDHFDLCLGSDPVIALQFDHISFAMEVGKKPDVDVKLNGIKFGGPLSFLETLKKLIPLDGFSDPPYLHIDKDGIHAGFTLAIPNVAVGMFSMENMAIAATLDVPFFTSGSVGAALTFTFSFCDKDHPFIITVSLLGGGGYFTVSLTPAGLQHLEASISVGAQLAINLFDIAQGSLSIMAGITFMIDNGDVSLTAFLRLHGELDILGIITISIDLNVSMTYDFTQNMLVAEAEIKASVSVLFFSMSVDLPFRKEFHSCNNDPTLRQLMPPDPTTNIPSEFWQQYVTAYA